MDHLETHFIASTVTLFQIILHFCHNSAVLLSLLAAVFLVFHQFIKSKVIVLLYIWHFRQLPQVQLWLYNILSVSVTASRQSHGPLCFRNTFFWIYSNFISNHSSFLSQFCSVEKLLAADFFIFSHHKTWNCILWSLSETVRVLG